MTKRTEYSLGVISTIVILGAVFGQQYFLSEEKEIFQNGKKTIGVAYTRIGAKGDSQVFKYKVNDVLYEGTSMNSNSFIVSGKEYFTVFYDSLNPEEAVISYFKVSYVG